MISFSKARDMFKLQRDAKRVKKELRNIHVEAEASASSFGGGTGMVKVVVNGEQEVVSIDIDPEVPRDRIGAMITDALNRAMKKAQVIASERMQGIMGDMGLPTGG